MSRYRSTLGRSFNGPDTIAEFADDFATEDAPTPEPVTESRDYFIPDSEFDPYWRKPRVAFGDRA